MRGLRGLTVCLRQRGVGGRIFTLIFGVAWLASMKIIFFSGESTEKESYTAIDQDSGRYAKSTKSCELWSPHVIIVIVTCLYLPYLRLQRQTIRNRLYKSLYRLRTLCCLLTTFISVLSLVNSQEEYGYSHILTPLSLICLCTWCHLEASRGLHPSIVPSAALLLLLTPYVTVIHVFLFSEGNGSCHEACSQSTFFFIPLSTEWPCIYVTCLKITCLFTISLDILTPTAWFDISNHWMPSSAKGQRVSPYSGSSLLSRITFAWIIPHMSKSQERELTIDDLYLYEDGHGCRQSLQALDKIMNQHQSYKGRDGWMRSYKHRDLIMGVLRLVQWPVVAGTIIHILATLTLCTNILNLRILIRFTESGNEDRWLGIYLALRVGVISVVWLVMDIFYFYMTNYAASRVKGLISGLVVTKFMKLSPRSRGQVGSDVMTYLTNDAQNVSDILGESNYGYEAIFTTPFYVWVLWTESGLTTTIIGTALISIIIYISVTIMRTKMEDLKEMAMERQTDRISLLQSILTGIKVLKLNAWEESYRNKVEEVRQEEVGLAVEATNLVSLSQCFLGVSSYMITSIMFFIYCYILKGNMITAEQIFVTMTAAGRIMAHAKYFPDFYACFTQGMVSLKRLLTYMDLEEMEVKEECSPQTYNPGFKVQITEGTFSLQEETPLMKSINLSVSPGDLVAVVGPVGSGKSLLLSAILGEMHTISGSASFSGSVALCQQEPWVLNATIQENIIFGRPYNHDFFQSVIDACELQYDINSFPAGVHTEVGERGITISGGQKHRLSLARALYADADIYLLDDPFSAVDAKVGVHLFDRVIGPQGLLRNKTRILVTHALQWLPQVDHVLLMEDGRIRASGSYNELHQTEVFLNNQNHAPLQNDRVRNLEKCLVESGINRYDGIGYSGQLMTKETMDRDQTSFSSLVTYQRHFGFSRCIAIVVAISAVACLRVGGPVWITLWSNEWKNNVTMAAENNNYRLTGFFIIGCFQALVMATMTLFIAAGAAGASKGLHNSLLNQVLHATPTFFDTTPSGRIINWFSKDINNVDNTLTHQLFIFIQTCPKVLGTMAMILWTIPIVILPCAPIVILYSKIKKLYTSYVKDLMRIDGISRSLAFSHFTQCIHGVVSIHAYKKTAYFKDKFYHLVDCYCRPYWHTAAATNFLRITTTSMANFIITVTCVMCVVNHDIIPTGFTAALIFSVMQLTWKFNDFCESSFEMERLLVAVERIVGKNHIIQEAPSYKTCDIPEVWPSGGRIEFTDYITSYRAGLNPALYNISFTIMPREKVGVIGRTGAGKSTLMLALLRMLEPSSGKITIDGVNIAKLGLHQLRSKVTLITQDPVLFSTSIRDNLDPFGCHSDEKIWKALDQAHLKPLLVASSKTLDTHCGNNGELLSLGERQLLCLARAMLRESKIIILDEPTASVDVHTDHLIQNTLMTCFKDCTIITVAHRLNTVIDYDRILVIKDGRVAEFDIPTKLLATTTSHLHKLGLESGMKVQGLPLAVGQENSVVKCSGSIIYM